MAFHLTRIGAASCLQHSNSMTRLSIARQMALSARQMVAQGSRHIDAGPSHLSRLIHSDRWQSRQLSTVSHTAPAETVLQPRQWLLQTLHRNAMCAAGTTAFSRSLHTSSIRRQSQSHPDSSKVPPPEDNDDEVNKLPLMQRTKALFRKYGKTAVAVYLFIGTADLAASYAAVRAGVDVDAVLHAAFSFVGVTDISTIISPTAGTFIAAYTVHKILTPVRILITASITPPLARYLARK